MFLFHLFHFFCFALSNIRKTKNTHLFFQIPFFTPNNLPKNIFRTPTLLVSLRYPKNTKQLGKNKHKTLGQSLDSTLARFLTQKSPNLGQSLDSTAYMYIYMCIYAGCCVQFRGAFCFFKGSKMLPFFASPFNQLETKKRVFPR